MIETERASRPLGNIEAAQRIIAIARELGVVDVAVCAGSRNAPLLAAVAADPALAVVSFVDERAAAFFALGRARANNRPAAVITTSGTAVAELLPAVVEAHYSGIPLLPITADRPPHFRGTGAPQSIEQPGIFGVYVEQSIDVMAADVGSLQVTWSRRRPLHLNVCFDEPLMDAPTVAPGATITRATIESGRDEIVDWQALHGIFEHAKRPLILIGELAREDVAVVRDFALRAGCAVYAEPLSGLRGDASLHAQRLDAGERIISRGAFDAVIRLGRIPALRYWRDLEETLTSIPVVSVDRLPFSGLSRGTMIVANLQSLGAADVPRRAVDPELIAFDRRRREELDALLDEEPQSELALVRGLSRAVPTNAHLFLGNSLPIREWDLVAARAADAMHVSANRGANGIDGELSTFFGACSSSRPNVALLGDLTALYDLNAPWVAAQLDAAIHFTIVILNNGGGRIFARVPSLAPLGRESRERIIENVHALRFEHFAAMWQLGYAALEHAPESIDVNARTVLELLPDGDASHRVWERYDALWRRT